MNGYTHWQKGVLPQKALTQDSSICKAFHVLFLGN